MYNLAQIRNFSVVLFPYLQIGIKRAYPVALWLKKKKKKKEIAMQEMQEMWVWSLSWEDPLEEEMAIHSSIFAWKIPWTEETGGLRSTKFAKV